MTSSLCLLVLALAVMVSTFAGCASTPAPAGDHLRDQAGSQTVTEATDEFYGALQAVFRGDAAPMKAAWWQDDEIAYMGPGGDYLIGWNDIEKEWDLQASRKLGGKVEPSRLHTIEGDDFAMITCVEVGSNVVNGKSATVSIRSSTVFRKRNGVWKAVSHQTDKLPYLENPE
jgi:ketosteroid isomerase-like protein